MSAPQNHLGQPSPAPPFRPSPTRAATIGSNPYHKNRAASQPAGERLPAPASLGGSQPDSGRGSPAGMFGVIGGSRTPSRFSAAPGTTTRANSFSAGEIRDTKNTLTRTLSSHIEEHPSRSQSTSPFPTFSPTSSVSTSPTSHLPLPLHNSPPKAGANVSRSRSQSLAVGVRPIGIGRGMGVGWMSSLDNNGAFPRSFDPGWGEVEGSNMSPFTRNVASMGRFGSPGSGLAKGFNTAWGSSAPEGHPVVSPPTRPGNYSTVVGGFGEPNGSRSGSSSRRHSVSVVGRRDLFAEGMGFGMTSPPGRGRGPLGFSDEELLPEKLGNALNLEIDQSRKRGVEIEVGRVDHSLPRFNPQDSYARRDETSRFGDPRGNSSFAPRPTFAPGPIGPNVVPIPFGRPPYIGPPSPVATTQPYGRPPFNPYGPPRPPPPPPPPQYQQNYSYYPQGSPPQPTSPSFSSLSLSDLGRGLPLATLPPITPLYIVTFKAGRRDVFYCPDPTLLISNGDRVIVEADRGSDLGTVVYDQLTPIDVRDWQEKQATAALLSGAREHQPPGMAVANFGAKPTPRVGSGELAGADLSTLLAGVGGGQMDSPMGSTSQRGPLAKEIMPKRIFAKSSQGPEEQTRMMDKLRDEQEALVICREKAAQRGMPMQIVDAEYQWDRRKLTFYFKADKRIDFRDLTKENFRIFKSRIWMAMVPKDDPRS